MRRVVVYGPVGPSRHRTEDIVRDVARELGEEVEVREVEDEPGLAFAGIVSTPAIEVDGLLRLAGRIPRPEEVRRWIGAPSRLSPRVTPPPGPGPRHGGPEAHR